MDQGLKDKMQQGALKSMFAKKKKVSNLDKLKNCPKQTGLFVNNAYIQIIMFLVTVYALVGDDVKLLGFTRAADDAFMWLNVMAIILFIIELICSSIGIDDYFGSFFFWLDLISTLSIVTDIEPLM